VLHLRILSVGRTSIRPNFLVRYFCEARSLASGFPTFNLFGNCGRASVWQRPRQMREPC
jgi:hypothetical protein